MNIDQQIYKAFLAHAGGIQENIKGLTRPTLIKMKKGKNKTRYSEVFEGMFANGINKISLHSEHTQMDFVLDGKEVNVITKSYL